MQDFNAPFIAMPSFIDYRVGEVLRAALDIII